MELSPRPALEVLLDSQRALAARVGPCLTPREILAEGQALLALAEREEEAFAALLPLVESSVTADLCEEHHELAEDLSLLDWLLRTAPDSPDTTTLAASLGRRMRQHLERDGRLLQRAVAMAAARREAS